MIGLAIFLAAVASVGDQGTLPTDLVLIEDHRVPLVELVLDFPVGTWSAWAYQHHAKEAFEIQLFDPDGSLRARADALGADLEVKMGRWSSRIRISCLSDDLDGALNLIRDLITNPAFDSHQLRRWNHRRRLDWDAAEKDPQFVRSQAQARLCFAASDPRRRSWEKPRKVLTDRDRLRATRDTVVRLPGRVIAFAGDLTRDQAEKAAAGLLPPALALPDRLEPAFSPVAANPGPAASQTISLRGLNQAYFALARASLTNRDRDWPAFLVADHVLGGHFFSRLAVALRHQGGETYVARTVNSGGPVVGTYALTTHTRADNASAVETKLEAVLYRFHEHGISEEERQAALGNLRGSLLLSRQSPAQVLKHRLWERRHGYPQGFTQHLLDQAAALSLAEINHFIATYYDPAQFTMIRVAAVARGDHELSEDTESLQRSNRPAVQDGVGA